MSKIKEILKIISDTEKNVPAHAETISDLRYSVIMYSSMCAQIKQLLDDDSLLHKQGFGELSSKDTNELGNMLIAFADHCKDKPIKFP